MPEALQRNVLHNNAFVAGIKEYCFFHQRWILAVISIFGVCNAYTMRVRLNFAITQMLFKKAGSGGGEGHVNKGPNPDQNLNKPSSASVSNPYTMFDWDEKTQGLLLSSFYLGYASTQVIGGIATEKYGGKWFLEVGLLSTALYMFLTPPVIRVAGAPGLCILRVLAGAGEGPAMPCLMIILARWVPPQERAVQGALVFGAFMSGILLAEGRDWSYVFYFFGGFGIIWLIMWALCAPLMLPFIKDKNMKYQQDIVIKAIAPTNEKDPAPWKAMLRSVPVWALVWAAVGHDWGYYAMVTDLPKYTYDVLKFDIKTAAATGPAIFIILASYIGCDWMLAIFYFVVSMALMAGFYPGMKVNALDLATNYAGNHTSVVNTTATLFGMLTPYIIRLLTPDSKLEAFWVCFAVLVGTKIIYIIWADGKQQWWDDVRQYGYPEGWKYGPLKLHETITTFLGR